MLDWNHDGKIDYKDYAFFDEVVYHAEKKQAENKRKEEQGVQDCNEGGAWSWVKTVFVFLVVAFLFGI